MILLFSVGFVAMGRHVVDAGAFYTYIGTGLGRTAGAGSASVALFAYCVIQAAMYGLYGSIVSGLVADHTGSICPGGSTRCSPWPWCRPWRRRHRDGARVLAVFVLAEFGILLVFSLVTLAKGGGPEGLGVAHSFAPSAA